MKTLILILKGILLYATITIITMFIGGIDSLYDKGLMLESILICVVLIYACFTFISGDDIDKLTLRNYLKDKVEK